MGAFFSDTPSTGINLSVPNYVSRTFSAAVGGGGGGGSTDNRDNTSAASGGSGGGYRSGTVPVTITGEVFYAVGFGGSRADGRNGTPIVTAGGNGGTSVVGGSNNRISAFGGNGGRPSAGQTGAGSSANGSVITFEFGNGENTINISSGSQARGGRGGGAGRPGGNCGGPNQGAGNDGIAGCNQHGGAGGHGVDVTTGNNNLNGPLAICAEGLGDIHPFLDGRPGGNHGAGGGGASRGNFSGPGAPGAVYISWITFSINGVERSDGGPNDPIVLRSNQPITLGWNSPYINNSQTVSFSNTGTTSITQTFSITDPRGAESTMFFTILPPPTIDSFTANPQTQTSGIDGIPNYDTFLSWTTTGATSVSLTDVGSVSFDGGTTVTTLPQSVVGSNSPATKTYTLTASDGFNNVTSSLTVSVTNDNTPDNFTIPDQTNVEPSTVITIQVGSITGIDMVTTVTGGPGVSVSNNNVTFSSSITIQNNQVFYVRVTSLPFNTSPNGLTNSASFSVTVGTVQRFFTVTTRAPDVNETFNYSNKDDYVPYPDIDTIPDPDADIRNQSNQYIISDTLLIDDVELGTPNGVEIKSSDPNVQMRVKRFGQSTFSSWQDIRSI